MDSLETLLYSVIFATLAETKITRQNISQDVKVSLKKDANFRDDLSAITSEELKGFLCVWNTAALCPKVSLSPSVQIVLICQIGQWQSRKLLGS